MDVHPTRPIIVLPDDTQAVGDPPPRPEHEPYEGTGGAIQCTCGWPSRADVDAGRLDYVEHVTADLRDRLADESWQHDGTYDEMARRVAIAESERDELRRQVVAVEALADEWDASEPDYVQTSPWVAGAMRGATKQLRAALASVGRTEPKCSTCGGTGLVDWEPFANRDSEEPQQPCPDCFDGAENAHWIGRIPRQPVGRTEPAPEAALTVESAPLGTRAPAYSGGAWVRVERGWQWNPGKANAGSTFPRPGGDWTGTLIPPPAVTPDEAGT